MLYPNIFKGTVMDDLMNELMGYPCSLEKEKEVPETIGRMTADVKEYDDRYEIVSLTGTISPDGSHMHISLADEDGGVIGGHMCNGCLVNTTAEVVLVSLDEEYRFSREYDDSTDYDELVIRKRQY